ncbi:MAG: ATP-dependent DNA helicase RecG, partial [Fimbriimonadaceae bacterium]
PNKAGLKVVRDVLYHFPRRYEDRSKLPSIDSLRPGMQATVRGRLASVERRPIRGGRVIITAYLTDGSGSMQLTWFNQPWVAKRLEDADEIIAYGTVRQSGLLLEMASPEFELVGDDEDAEAFARIWPVYPLTEGLPQKSMRRAARAAVEGYAGLVEDILPEPVRREHDLPDVAWCLRQMHLPESETARRQARRRMVFEEFLLLQLALQQRRAEVHTEPGIAFDLDASGAGESDLPAGNLFAASPEAQPKGSLWDEVARMLPFELTGAQKRVIGEIWSDMRSPHPMNRLVQGDVGSGKTAVAACAMLAAVRCGYQAALMAPTEILAEQHFAVLHRLFDPLGVEVALLVGKQTPTQRRKALDHTATGIAKIAVGTHALIQSDVKFPRLGLVVIDEQHRFGVEQRVDLRRKGLGNPDVLVMTATPIPRTLTMAIYGDLDQSILDELPPGRRPVKTHAKLPSQRDQVYAGVRKLIAEGRQAYFVCPMVAESESTQAQAAQDLHYRLSHDVFPDLRVGLLHGQLKAKEKEDVMARFRDHELDILVATTVIEVGVDVPNASVMVIEDANRFGLSQLHQLRGRVGRGAHQSYCILIADVTSEDARARIDAMVETSDGFRIAEIDLRLRGPGELTGTRQSGVLAFQVADLVQDAKVLEEARQAAQRIIDADRALSKPEHAGLREASRRFRPELAAVVVS